MYAYEEVLTGHDANGYNRRLSRYESTKYGAPKTRWTAVENLSDIADRYKQCTRVNGATEKDIRAAIECRLPAAPDGFTYLLEKETQIYRSTGSVSCQQWQVLDTAVSIIGSTKELPMTLGDIKAALTGCPGVAVKLLAGDMTTDAKDLFWPDGRTGAMAHSVEGDFVSRVKAGSSAGGWRRRRYTDDSVIVEYNPERAAKLRKRDARIAAGIIQAPKDRRNYIKEVRTAIETVGRIVQEHCREAMEGTKAWKNQPESELALMVICRYYNVSEQPSVIRMWQYWIGVLGDYDQVWQKLRETDEYQTAVHAFAADARLRTYGGRAITHSRYRRAGGLQESDWKWFVEFMTTESKEMKKLGLTAGTPAAKPGVTAAA